MTTCRPGCQRVDVTVEPTGRCSGGLPPVELAAFGDSAVAGVGVEQAKDSLLVQLAQRVADGLARRVHVVGYRRSGARTADVLAAQIPLARGGPDVSVLLVGTNDVTHVTPLRRLARGSDALLDALLNLGGPVVMSGLPEFRALTAVRASAARGCHRLRGVGQGGSAPASADPPGSAPGRRPGRGGRRVRQ